jgi:hypothetical protein
MLPLESRVTTRDRCSLAEAMAGSDNAIKRRFARLGIGQSKLHSQTHRVHIRRPIKASTQRPSATQIRKRIRRALISPRSNPTLWSSKSSFRDWRRAGSQPRTAIGIIFATMMLTTLSLLVASKT